eukprot:TRINITY_DN43866_c0_g1_i1.p1 TRINITY_DN43866_c0_g1~~TRINITY_DN43866_c0_g1_i1.p1  ORF type:complete len:377 (+),score=101.83 TRINITY_DN43866_c0_g1_i1:65-1132(+)
MAYLTKKERKERKDGWTREKWRSLSLDRGTGFLMGMVVTAQEVDTGRTLTGWGGTSVELTRETDFGAVLVVASASARPSSVCPRSFFQLKNIHRILGAVTAKDENGEPREIPGHPGVILYDFKSPAPLDRKQGPGDPNNSRLSIEVTHRKRRVWLLVSPGVRPRVKLEAGGERKPQDLREWQSDRDEERKTLQLLGSLIMNALSPKVGGQGTDPMQLPIKVSVGRSSGVAFGDSRKRAPAAPTAVLAQEPKVPRGPNAQDVHNMVGVEVHDLEEEPIDDDDLIGDTASLRAGSVAMSTGDAMSDAGLRAIHVALSPGPSMEPDRPDEPPPIPSARGWGGTPSSGVTRFRARRPDL